MHDKKLLLKDLMYIMQGSKAIKSIQFKIDQYIASIQSKKSVSSGFIKATHYVKIANAPIVFGMQIRLNQVYLVMY